jgi:hypothetical protein
MAYQQPATAAGGGDEDEELARLEAELAAAEAIVAQEMKDKEIATQRDAAAAAAAQHQAATQAQRDREIKERNDHQRKIDSRAAWPLTMPPSELPSMDDEGKKKLAKADETRVCIHDILPHGDSLRLLLFVCLCSMPISYCW